MTTYEKIKLIKDRQEYQLKNNIERETLEKILNCKNDLSGYLIGYHTPANANWSYEVELVTVDGKLFEIVKRFGETIAAAFVSLPAYSINDLRINENEL